MWSRMCPTYGKERGGQCKYEQMSPEQQKYIKSNFNSRRNRAHLILPLSSPSCSRYVTEQGKPI